MEGDWPNHEPVESGDLVVFGRDNTLWLINEVQREGSDSPIAYLKEPLIGGMERSEVAQTAYLRPFDPSADLPVSLPSGRDSTRSLSQEECPDCGANRAIASSHRFAGVHRVKCAVCDYTIDS